MHHLNAALISRKQLYQINANSGSYFPPTIFDLPYVFFQPTQINVAFSLVETNPFKKYKGCNLIGVN